MKSDYVTAAKRSVLDYLLLDKEERERLGISVRPGPWEPRVVRAPVPWHQNFLQASVVTILSILSPEFFNYLNTNTQKSKVFQ